MADIRPSSAPLFETREVFNPGILTEDLDVDTVLQAKGANQFLGDFANHHDGQSTLGPNGNRVQSGQLPRTSSGRAGKPDAANPLGSGKSLNG